MDSPKFPQPSAQQARLIWLAVTALSLALFLAVLCALFWGLGWVVQRLTPVLLPLAIAGIIAYLLDPLVDFLEARKMRRSWAILLVFLIGLGVIAGICAFIIPRVIVEMKDLAEQIPYYRDKIILEIQEWLTKSRWGQKFKAAWATDLRDSLQGWAQRAAPALSAWFVSQASRIASWFGLIVGVAMVPVYLFYLLLEKQGIKMSWTNYLPIHESRWKDEVVFIITQINDYLILFFRGQILVALCDGILLTIGFLAIGLNYALLLGMVAGLLSIVPFLGVAISIIPALLLAVVQFGDWLHPALVLGVFGTVQFLEGFFISPKIMGDRVGLHPLTIILAVMIGTTLMGGIIGG
ncbi:MAG TPA: AI-2E family transporter, partial [Verrucomicrobiae bacterium]|nr:AI-2E family transporter [Verrucomicrobiae bacterium]